MPNFAKPFCCGLRDLKENELRSALQQSIADEYEAASRYRAIADHAQEPRVKQLYNDIAKEEIVHVGEFSALLNELFPDDEEFLKKGMKEAKKLLSIDSADEAGKQTGATVHVCETVTDSMPIRSEIVADGNKKIKLKVLR